MRAKENCTTGTVFLPSGPLWVIMSAGCPDTAVKTVILLETYTSEMDATLEPCGLPAGRNSSLSYLAYLRGGDEVSVAPNLILLPHVVPVSGVLQSVHHILCHGYWPFKDYHLF